jgi:peptide/nickel transport system substrate-binding protein
MNRRDFALVLVLLVALAATAVLVGAPALEPAASVATPTPPPIADDTDRPYREGVLGQPVSASPLTARSQADRDLVALLFPGLVRNGPNGRLVPDLATQWSVSEDGRTWTFELRDDARWHDGEPVTAEDVVFTVRTLQDPAYTGPQGASWAGVEVQATGVRTVVFTLETALGGFLQAATQPIAPVHLLGDVPVGQLADDAFGRRPVGSGAFELIELSEELAVLRPRPALADPDTPSPDPTAIETDSLATPRPTVRPDVPRPYLDGIEFHYYADAATLAADYAAGQLDGVSGVDPDVAAELDEAEDTFLLRYPGSTLTAVLLNLRPGHPEFATPAVRTALLQAIDRSALIDAAFHGNAIQAESPIPPSAPVFDPAAAPPVAHDPAAAAAALEKAGWSKVDGAWRLPSATEPFEIELLSPNPASNPAVHAAAVAFAGDWTAFGLRVRHVALPVGEFATNRIATGTYSAAVADLAIGLDPDLYPLFASTQTVTGGSNVIGLQDPVLDPLLATARAPGSDAARRAAYAKLQAQLSAGRYLLPLGFADETVVVNERVSGPVVRQVADLSDRFWDVLTWRLADDR